MYGAQEFNDTSDTPDLGESLGHDPPKQAVPPQHGPSGYYAQPDCCPGVMGAGVQSMPMCYGNPYMGSAPGGMGYSAAPWCQTLPAWGGAACPGQAAQLAPPQRIPHTVVPVGLTKEQKELGKLARDQARYALKLDAAKSLKPGFKTSSGLTTWDGESTSWEPKEAAPGLKHLLHAGLGRAKPLPKQAASQNWPKEKVIKWLLETPYLQEGEEVQEEAVAAPALPHDRWTMRVHTIRLLPVCVELKVEFLQKDV